MRYEHKQSAPLYLVLLSVGVVMLATAWSLPERLIQIILATSGVLICVLAMGFHHLRVCDEGDRLLIAFGPLPLFRRRIRYADIDRVEQARSTLLDGWGIHLSLRGGWTWNLWGFDCVDVWYTKAAKTKKVRIGTDDPEGLTAFLRQAREQLPQ